MLVLEIAQNSVETLVIHASIRGYKKYGGWVSQDQTILLFDRTLDMWPNCSVEVEGPGQQTSPPLGYCWYSAESWPNVYKENWKRSI